MNLLSNMRIVFSGLLLVASLVGCGGSSSDSSNSSTDCAYNATSQLCAGTSSSGASGGSATSCPTLAGYRAVQAGMSYAQVVATLGCAGTLDQTAKRDNVTQSYYWGAWASDYYGPGVYIVFVNGGVSLKSARFNGVAY